MANPASRQLARELVESISESHGYLGEDTLGRMEPSVRLKVEEALLRKDELIGDSVVTYDIPSLISPSIITANFGP